MRVLGMALLVIGVAACGPLYGGKPQKLPRTPAVVKHDPPPVEPLVFKDDCGEPTGPKSKKTAPATRNTTAAERLVEAGDRKQTEAAKEAAIDKKKELIVASIDNYIRALQSDPFDAEATLKLALAYHKTQRKGCALVMLRRLDKLSTHPTFQDAANAQKQEVYDHTQWFAEYRPEALKAIP
ncbi:MAG: hypothetical protein ABI867_44970 [Kofleriaceae bacterium]